MRKEHLDHLLETAVAKALGVTMPVHHRRPHRASKKSAQHLQKVQHAA